jgi:hypothetical protein
MRSVNARNATTLSVCLAILGFFATPAQAGYAKAVGAACKVKCAGAHMGCFGGSCACQAGYVACGTSCVAITNDDACGLTCNAVAPDGPEGSP